MLIKGIRTFSILSFLLSSAYFALDKRVLLNIRHSVFDSNNTKPGIGQHIINITTHSDGTSIKNKTLLPSSIKNKTLLPSISLINNSRSLAVKDVPIPRSPEPSVEDVPIPYVRLRDKDTDIHFRCSSCAVVTSSGHVLASNKGLEIDSKECVIRMNDAPVEGYKHDVGTRTTIRVIGFPSFRLNKRKLMKALIPRIRNVTYIVWGPEQLMHSGDQNFIRIKMFADKIRGNWVFFDRKKMNQMDNLYEKESGESRRRSGAWLSTGWFTLNVAKDLCDEIHVYGMPSDNYCRRVPTSKVPYHYYNPSGPTQCSYYQFNQRTRFGHRFLTEKQIFRGWVKKYNIHFHTPKW